MEPIVAAAERPRLIPIQEVEDFVPGSQPRPAPPADSAATRAGTEALILGLKALSQRAVAAAKTYFTLLSLVSCWWLWHTIPDPNNTQLVSLGMYALFVLAANVIVRRM